MIYNLILFMLQAPELSKRNGIIIDYRINFYQTISQNKIKHNVTTSLTDHFILDGLRPYTTYTIQVQALTRQGGGPLSDGNTATTLEGGMKNALIKLFVTRLTLIQSKQKDCRHKYHKYYLVFKIKAAKYLVCIFM